MYYLTLTLIALALSVFTTILIGYLVGIPFGKSELHFDNWVGTHPWLHRYSRYLFPVCSGVYFLVFLLLR